MKKKKKDMNSLVKKLQLICIFLLKCLQIQAVIFLSLCLSMHMKVPCF